MRRAAHLSDAPRPEDDWTSAACQTFGAPWLEPILHLTRSRSGLELVTDPMTREMLENAAREIWNAAVVGQSRHVEMTRAGRAPSAEEADELKQVHAALVTATADFDETVTLARTSL